MSYIVVTRNPSNNKLLVFQNPDGAPLEFDTEYDAIQAADKINLYKAWGFETLEVGS